MSTTSERRPNVLLLIWDACRLDSAREHAPTLRDLAARNVQFENAVVPAPWSLPSHASLFSGKYPHEHGTNRLADTMTDVGLLDHFDAAGYRSIGVSGNGFVSPKTNLHEWFDAFHYTSGQGPFVDGLDVYSYVFGRADPVDGLDPVHDGLATARAVLRHDHPLKSLVNAGAVALNRLAAHVEPLQRIPHPTFDPFQPHSYSPERNTRLLTDWFAESAERDEPFLAVANYMDTHAPYDPPKRLQREQLGETLSYGEIKRLNDEVADPWEFLSRHERGELDPDDVATIRNLYAGEVRSVDEHLAQLLASLERHGLREDTVVVVTADHGENLGETDPMGRTRMGHESSVSDELFRVPLVVANPALEARTVTEYVNTKDLFALCTEGLDALLGSGGADLGGLLPEGGVVVGEYPGTGGEELYDSYPEIPTEVIDQRAVHDVAVAYAPGWRVVADSTGERWAWHDGERVDFAAAPDTVREACERHLEALVDAAGDAEALSEVEVSRLEALGYL